MTERQRGPGRVTDPVTAPKRTLRSTPQYFALERRMMFDGAAIQEVAAMVASSAETHDQSAPHDGPKDAWNAFLAPGGKPTFTGSARDGTALPSRHAEASSPRDRLAERQADITATEDLRQHDADGLTGALNLTAHEIVFIDSSVSDWQSLAAGTRADVQVVVLDHGANPWAQMTTVISQYQDLTAIHIVSHGVDGSVILGGKDYDAASLDAEAQQLAIWQSHLAENADILLYGCDIGAGTDGQILVDSLARITSADVAASTDVTGAAALGGDWVLERQTGTVDAALFSETAILASYNDILAAPVNNVPDTSFIPLSVAIDTPLAFTGSRLISIADANSDLTSVALSVEHGTLTVTAAGSAVISGANSKALQISGSLADINNTLASLTYQGVTGYHGQDALTVLSIDASSNTDTDTVAIGVTAQVPTLTIASSKSVSENAAASQLTATAVISEDAATLNGGGIRVTGLDTQDILDISASTANTNGAIRRDGNSIQLGDGTTWTTIGSISGGAGNQLRITFTSDLVTSSVAESVIKAITFYNNSDSPVTSRALYMTVLDADGGPSTVQTITVNITPINDAPSLTIDSTKTVMENAPASPLVPSAVLLDPDSGNLGGGVITVSGLAAGDVVSLPTTTDHTLGAIWLSGSNVMRGNGSTSSVIGTLAGGSGGSDLTITLSSAAVTVTPVIAERVLATLTFYNNSDTPVANRTLKITVSDGAGGTSAAQNVAVAVTAVNDTPTLSVDATRTFTENVSGSALFASVSVADLDSANFNGGGIVITGLDTADVISISTTTNNTAGAIWLSGSDIKLGNGSSSSTIGTLSGGAGTTLRISFTSASATPTVVTNVLKALTFSNSADNPVASRTLRVTVNDGAGATSAASTSVVTIRAVNDAPVISTPATNITLYVSSGSPAPPSGAVGLTLNQLFLTGRINDPDGTSWSNMGIAISGIAGANNLQAVHFSLDGGTNWTSVKGSSLTATSYLVLANTPSTRIYFELKQAQAGTTTTFTNFLSLYAWDQSATATSGTYASVSSLAGSLSASSVNVDLAITSGTPPANSVPASYTVTEDTPLRLSDISVTDADGTNSFTIKLSVGSGQGIITATSAGSVTVSGSGTNVLTLTGTLANINAYLASSSTQPLFTPAANSTTAVTLNVLSTDSTGLTASSNVTISITAVNDAPGVDLNGVASGSDSLAGFVEGGGGVRIAPNATLSDLDSTNLSGMTITLAARPDGNAYESLAVGTAGGLTWTYTASTGVLALSGTASVATYETALRSVTYANTSPAPTLTPRTITVTATDGTDTSTQRTATISMTAVNSAPVLVTPLTDQTATAGLPFSYTFSASVFSDPEGDTLIYRASLADGSVLPSWLSYNTATHTFSGVPPTTGTISIKVTATDPSGASASTSFDLLIQPSTSVVSVGFPKVYQLVNPLWATDGNATTTDLYTGYYGLETNSIITDSKSLVGSNFTFYQNSTASSFSGNNVPGFLTYLDASGQVVSIAGYVTRPVKSGGTVEGVYFVTDSDRVSNTTAGNTAYLLVINESFFAASGTYNSSSDPIDTALNTYYLTASVSISGGNVTEGGNVSFTITRSSSDGAASVQYSTTLLGGDTASYSDFNGTSGTVSFAAGETTKTITVKTTDDTFYEPDETFSVTLSNPSTNLRLGTSSATGVILNNDLSATFSVSNAGAVEGNTITFTVTRTGDAQSSQSVSYVTTLQGSDTAALDDFTLRQGTLTFQAGETQKTITVSTTQDTVLEEDETFTLVLSNATGGATVSSSAGQATGTIENDEGVVIYSVSDVSVSEASGQLTLTVTRTGDVAANQSLDYTFSPGTAGAGTDYAAINGTLNFTQGVNSQTISVAITTDNLYEATESFRIALGNLTAITNTKISSYQSSATGWIIDDDAMPSFSIADAYADEGGRITFTVIRTNDAQDTVSVYYNTFISATDTASTADFNSTSGTLSFAQGEMSKTVTVQTFADILSETNETFSIQLTAGGSATLSAPSALGTIVERIGTVEDQQNNALLGPSSNLSGDLSENSLNLAGATLTYAISGGVAISYSSSGITYDQALSGTYGTLHLASTGANAGAYIYVANAALINALNTGDAPRETFEITITDQTGQTISQTVTVDLAGANEAPVVDLQPTLAGTIDHSHSFTINGDPVAFATIGTNLSDADSAATLTYLAVNYAKATILNGGDEQIIINDTAQTAINLAADTGSVRWCRFSGQDAKLIPT